MICISAAHALLLVEKLNIRIVVIILLVRNIIVRFIHVSELLAGGATGV